MIHFFFNGFVSDRLVAIPVSYSETQNAEDPQILDVEIVMDGQAFFDTATETDDALVALEAFCAIETGSFSILFRNVDENLTPSTIQVSANECVEAPTVVDFVRSGDEFSFRIVAKRHVPQRLSGELILGRSLAYAVTGSGGPGIGTAKRQLWDQWTTIQVNVSGTIVLNGWRENVVEQSFFGTVQADAAFMPVVSTVISGNQVASVVSTNATSERTVGRLSTVLVIS